MLLGEVIAAVAGSTWAAEVRRRIIAPLHLQRMHIAGAEPVPGGVLPGYFDTDNDGDEENIETGRPWPSLETAEGPAGAIVSTAADLAVFGAALFRGCSPRNGCGRCSPKAHITHGTTTTGSAWK